ncbi:MAG: MFS transporter [Elainella sp.]
MQTANSDSLRTDSLLTKATLLLVSTLTVMAGATIAPSLPEMQRYFGQVQPQVGQIELWVRLVLTVPALFIAIGSPIVGSLIDRWGRKPLLLLAALLYGLAGSSGYLLNTLGWILIGRALLGLAVAGVMVTATTLIADYYQGQARASFMGLQAAFMGLGGVLFLTGGGLLADLSWRLPFLIYLFAWLLLPLIALLPEPDRRTLSPSQAAANQPIATPVRLLLFVFGATLLSQIVFYLIPVQLAFYLKSLVNASAAQSGFAIALATLFSALASLAYGRLKQKFGFVSLLALAFGLMGIGYSLIGWADTYSLVLLGLGVAGLGLGLLMPNLTLWVAGSVPESVRGRALGGLTTSLFLGQFLSPLVSQPLSHTIGLGPTYAAAGLLMLALGLGLAAGRQQVLAFVSPRL